MTRDQPAVSLLDEKGVKRAGLAARGDRSMLWLFDRNGRMRAVLGTYKNGPVLSLLDRHGNERAGLGAYKTKKSDGKITTYPESSVLLFDGDGTMIWKAPQ